MVQETETHQERAAAVERVHLHMQGAAGGFGAKGGPACGHGKGGGGVLSQEGEKKCLKDAPGHCVWQNARG